MTSIPQFRYDSEKKKWQPTSFKKSLSSKSLKLISYNVWFNTQVSFEKRVQSLIEIFKSKQADVIGLQEVILSFLRLIKEDPWIQQNCFLSDIEGTTFAGYGLLSYR